MNRGSTALGTLTAVRRGSFNEAPIHESGKCPVSPGGESQRNGFNEAPIHESGKCSQALLRQSTVLASMRPRFMNRGSNHDRTHGRGSLGLQ